MDYLIDTNIIIIYSRENDFTKKIEEKYDKFIKSLKVVDTFLKCKM